MEKLFASILLTLSALAMSYLILKYWNKKLLKDFNSDEVNTGFAIFVVFQILAIFISVYFALDIQTLAIIESLQPFSSSDYRTFWSTLGLLIVGLALIYIVSVFIALIIYKSTVTTRKEFRENINSGNIPVSLITGILIFLICVALSYYSLRIVLADWVMGTITYVPLN